MGGSAIFRRLLLSLLLGIFLLDPCLHHAECIQIQSNAIVSVNRVMPMTRMAIGIKKVINFPLIRFALYFGAVAGLFMANSRFKGSMGIYKAAIVALGVAFAINTAFVAIAGWRLYAGRDEARITHISIDAGASDSLAMINVKAHYRNPWWFFISGEAKEPGLLVKLTKLSLVSKGVKIKSFITEPVAKVSLKQEKLSFGHDSQDFDLDFEVKIADSFKISEAYKEIKSATEDFKHLADLALTFEIEANINFSTWSLLFPFWKSSKHIVETISVKELLADEQPPAPKAKGPRPVSLSKIDLNKSEANLELSYELKLKYPHFDEIPVQLKGAQLSASIPRVVFSLAADNNPLMDVYLNPSKLDMQVGQSGQTNALSGMIMASNSVVEKWESAAGRLAEDYKAVTISVSAEPSDASLNILKADTESGLQKLLKTIKISESIAALLDMKKNALNSLNDLAGKEPVEIVKLASKEKATDASKHTPLAKIVLGSPTPVGEDALKTTAHLDIFKEVAKEFGVPMPSSLHSYSPELCLDVFGIAPNTSQNLAKFAIKLSDNSKESTYSVDLSASIHQPGNTLLSAVSFLKRAPSAKAPFSQIRLLASSKTNGFITGLLAKFVIIVDISRGSISFEKNQEADLLDVLGQGSKSKTTVKVVTTLAETPVHKFMLSSENFNSSPKFLFHLDLHEKPVSTGPQIQIVWPQLEIDLPSLLHFSLQEGALKMSLDEDIDLLALLFGGQIAGQVCLPKDSQDLIKQLWRWKNVFEGGSDALDKGQVLKIGSSNGKTAVLTLPIPTKEWLESSTIAERTSQASTPKIGSASLIKIDNGGLIVGLTPHLTAQLNLFTVFFDISLPEKLGLQIFHPATSKLGVGIRLPFHQIQGSIACGKLDYSIKHYLEGVALPSSTTLPILITPMVDVSVLLAQMKNPQEINHLNIQPINTTELNYLDRIIQAQGKVSLGQTAKEVKGLDSTEYLPGSINFSAKVESDDHSASLMLDARLPEVPKSDAKCAECSPYLLIDQERLRFSANFSGENSLVAKLSKVHLPMRLDAKLPISHDVSFSRDVSLSIKFTWKSDPHEMRGELWKLLDAKDQSVIVANDILAGTNTGAHKGSFSIDKTAIRDVLKMVHANFTSSIDLKKRVKPDPPDCKEKGLPLGTKLSVSMAKRVKDEQAILPCPIPTVCPGQAGLPDSTINEIIALNVKAVVTDFSRTASEQLSSLNELLALPFKFAVGDVSASMEGPLEMSVAVDEMATIAGVRIEPFRAQNTAGPDKALQGDLVIRLYTNPGSPGFQRLFKAWPQAFHFLPMPYLDRKLPVQILPPVTLGYSAFGSRSVQNHLLCSLLPQLSITNLLSNIPSANEKLGETERRDPELLAVTCVESQKARVVFSVKVAMPSPIPSYLAVDLGKNVSLSLQDADRHSIIVIEGNPEEFMQKSILDIRISIQNSDHLTSLLQQLLSTGMSKLFVSVSLPENPLLLPLEVASSAPLMTVIDEFLNDDDIYFAKNPQDPTQSYPQIQDVGIKTFPRVPLAAVMDINLNTIYSALMNDFTKLKFPFGLRLDAIPKSIWSGLKKISNVAVYINSAYLHPQFNPPASSIDQVVFLMGSESAIGSFEPSKSSDDLYSDFKEPSRKSPLSMFKASMFKEPLQDAANPGAQKTVKLPVEKFIHSVSELWDHIKAPYSRSSTLDTAIVLLRSNADLTTLISTLFSGEMKTCLNFKPGCGLDVKIGQEGGKEAFDLKIPLIGQFALRDTEFGDPCKARDSIGFRNHTNDIISRIPKMKFDEGKSTSETKKIFKRKFKLIQKDIDSDSSFTMAIPSNLFIPETLIRSTVGSKCKKFNVCFANGKKTMVIEMNLEGAVSVKFGAKFGAKFEKVYNGRFPLERKLWTPKKDVENIYLHYNAAAQTMTILACLANNTNCERTDFPMNLNLDAIITGAKYVPANHVPSKHKVSIYIEKCKAYSSNNANISFIPTSVKYCQILFPENMSGVNESGRFYAELLDAHSCPYLLNVDSIKVQMVHSQHKHCVQAVRDKKDFWNGRHRLYSFSYTTSIPGTYRVQWRLKEEDLWSDITNYHVHVRGPW